MMSAAGEAFPHRAPAEGRKRPKFGAGAGGPCTSSSGRLPRCAAGPAKLKLPIFEARCAGFVRAASQKSKKFYARLEGSEFCLWHDPCTRLACRDAGMPEPAGGRLCGR